MGSWPKCSSVMNWLGVHENPWQGFPLSDAVMQRARNGEQEAGLGKRRNLMEKQFDLAIKSARGIDPAQCLDRKRNTEIRDRHIAALSDEIPDIICAATARPAEVLHR